MFSYLLKDGLYYLLNCLNTVSVAMSRDDMVL